MTGAGGDVLVTGGAGFVGSHVVEALLRRGRRVRVLVRPSTDRRFLDAGRVSFAVGDVGDEDPGAAERLAQAARGCDVVIHAAGIVTAGRAEEYARVNAAGSERMARAAAEAGVRRFVVVSSQAAAGPNPGAAPRTEEDADGPVTAYGLSKLAGEQAAASVSAARGMEWVIVRPPAVYGPRDRAFLMVFRMVRRGVLALHANASRQVVSLVHAADLAEGIVLAAERSASGRTYFLTDGAAHTAGEIGDAIARSLGARPIRLTVPAPVAWSAALFSETAGRLSGRPARLTRERLRQWTAPYWTVSDARARGELGYGSRFDLASGMLETADWYRKSGWI